MKVNVFALPYAFGASYIYNNFKKACKDVDINVIPIEYPGHGLKYSEALVNNIPELAKDAYTQIEKYLDSGEEYSILGYSMGGKVAYELYKLIVEKKQRKPKAFFAFAADAPNEAYCKKDYEQYDMEEIRTALKNMRGTPRAILEDDDMLELLTPIIINDLVALRDYHQYADYNTKIDCPLVLVRGREEKSADSFAKWNTFCNAESRYYEVNGEHFFLFEDDVKLRECVGIVSKSLSNAL